MGSRSRRIAGRQRPLPLRSISGRTAQSAATEASNRLEGHAVDCSGMLAAYNLGYFVGAVQNTMRDLGTVDNYSLVADIANAWLGSIPYGGAAATSLVSAWG
jgi:hypothetical protein